MERLSEIFEEYNGTEPIDNIDECIYITFEGDLLDGEFSNGIRGNDHNILLGCFDLENSEEGWRELHLKYNVIRYVPEIKLALYKEGQKISEEQQNIIEMNGVELQPY